MTTAVLDHTCLTALHGADSFFIGLYIEASRGGGSIVIPALSAVVAEQAKQGVGSHALALRHTSVADFTGVHAQDAGKWARADWRILHPAALAVAAQRAGADWTLLSLDPALYEGTGVVPLNPLGD
ncbi:hypothetical protein [Streptomyces sp. NPDC059009]|uniref:hypothetical protein n=1 Tax=Streptomyces sp. NPDC059009 TaxID=3346694 RepID=UPI0036A2D1BF